MKEICPAVRAPHDGIGLNDLCTLKPNKKVHLRPGQSFETKDNRFSCYKVSGASRHRSVQRLPRLTRSGTGFSRHDSKMRSVLSVVLDF